MPTSPTGTQATSLFEGGSEGSTADIALPEGAEGERNGSGEEGRKAGSSLFGGSVGSGIGETRKGVVSNGHSSGGTVGPGLGIGDVRGRGGAAAGDGRDREVRRKGSRFRFDFWKKKRAGEVSP